MAPAKPAKTTTTSTGGRPAPRVRWALAAGLAAVAVVALVVVSVVTGRSDQTPHMDHVHGLGVDPADGALYAATHNGVYRLPAQGPARQVGKGRQDTMGFTVAGARHFLASGHPAPGAPGGPHLGLIESTDAGVTWRSLSLAGTADFHVLRYRHGTAYGYNSTTGQVMISSDRVAWEARSRLALRDFAVSPSDPNTLLATAQNGVMRSADGGRTWTPAGDQPLLLLDWEHDDRLWGVTPGGDIVRSPDGGATWAQVGKVTGAPTAFVAHDGDLYVALEERGIFHSRDAGGTWERRYP